MQVPATHRLVHQLRVVSLCTVTGAETTGYDPFPYTTLFRSNVYNLSAMTEAEGEALIIEKEGKLCARIYRGYNGTLLSRECLVCWRPVRRRLAWSGMRTVAAVVCIISGTAYAANAGRPKIMS